MTNEDERSRKGVGKMGEEDKVCTEVSAHMILVLRRYVRSYNGHKVRDKTNSVLVNMHVHWL